MPAAVADDVAALCLESGSCGVQTQDAGTLARLAIYFEGGDADGRRAQLARCLEPTGWLPGGAGALLAEVEAEADWAAEWRRHYRPVWATARIVVHPPWIPVTTGWGQHAIAIDPAMAFGTGGHESTQLALEALEATGCLGRRCLDLGTGSGVLAIAAKQLGACHVTAIDVDPVAVDNARHNLRQNLGADAEGVRVLTGDVELVAGEHFGVIVANLESHLVRPLLPAVFAATEAGGAVLCSGILALELARFCGWLAQAGGAVDAVWSRHEWVGLRARVG